MIVAGTNSPCALASKPVVRTAGLPSVYLFESRPDTADRAIASQAMLPSRGFALSLVFARNHAPHNQGVETV